MLAASAEIIDLVCSSEDGSEEPAPPQKKQRGRGRPRKHPFRFGVVPDAAFVSSSNRIYFEVSGKPFAWERPSPGRWNKRPYNKCKDQQKQFATVFKDLREAAHTAVDLVGPKTGLKANLVFLFPKDSPPGCLWESDLDNLCKFVFDSLNKVAYPDDRYFLEITARKAIDEKSGSSGRTIVEITVPKLQ